MDITFVKDEELIALGLKDPELQIPKKPFLLYPDMIFSSFWQIVISIVLLISVFITPFNLAFDKYNDPIDYPSYAVLLNTIDALFWMDFLVQFFLVTEKEDGSPEDDRKEIVINYLRGWFAIDFCSNFPFDKIIEAI